MTKLTLPNNLSVHILPEARNDAKYIYKEIFKDNCYLQHGIIVNNGDFILDIGANIGLFTIKLAQTFNDIKIYSFEPTPPIFDCLKNNVSCYKNVEAFNSGFADKEKETEIEYFPHSPGNSTLYPHEKENQAELFSSEANIMDVYKINKLYFFLLLLTYPFRKRILKIFFDRLYSNGKKYRCKLTSLDKFIYEKNIEHIDLLKIDVEGAEKDVFEGLCDENLKKIKQVVLEISPKNKKWIKELKLRLASCGFLKINMNSLITGSDPEKDVYACNLYAVR
ncbi:MAG: FkbM family methyltransferase [Candidatus Anammoxibacter sp.]